MTSSVQSVHGQISVNIYRKLDITLSMFTGLLQQLMMASETTIRNDFSTVCPKGLKV